MFEHWGLETYSANVRSRDRSSSFTAVFPQPLRVLLVPTVYAEACVNILFSLDLYSFYCNEHFILMFLYIFFRILSK